MGDGNFRWWQGNGQEPERYSGPYDSRDEAIEMGREEDDSETGFTVCEADKAVVNLDIFDADQVFDSLLDRNEEAVDEDGELGINPTSAQKRDLEDTLRDAFKAWMDRHGLKAQAWSFGDVRSQEYFPPQPAAAVETK